MAQVNQESNLVNRVVALEREAKAIRKLAGNSSSIITRGGLTILNDAFIRTLDADGSPVFRTGPAEDGRQEFVVGRVGAGPAFEVLVDTGQPIYWRLRDRAGHHLISDDPSDDNGLARPFLDVTLYPKFAMAAGTFPYMSIAAASITSETQLWEGRVGLVSHPRIRVFGIFGQATGSNNCTYRLKEVGGATLGTWNTGASLVNDSFTFDITSRINNPSVPIELTAQASGTGTVACQVLGCVLKGTEL